MIYRFTDELNDEYIDIVFSQEELLEILEDIAYEKLFTKLNENDENFDNIKPCDFF